jgi:aspartate-semialdehyde dehydrogenase
MPTGVPVVSNNSAHRWTPDVHVIPELNPEHIKVVEAQRKRLGCGAGSSQSSQTASIQAMCPLFIPCAVSVWRRSWSANPGDLRRGKTFQTWPEMADNMIPYIAAKRRSLSRSP